MLFLAITKKLSEKEKEAKYLTPRYLKKIENYNNGYDDEEILLADCSVIVSDSSLCKGTYDSEGIYIVDRSSA